MYRTTLDRIMLSDKTSSDLALKALAWVCYDQRPLYKAELQHAVATELDDDFDPDEITILELIQASSMGLLFCDDQGRVGLFHLTAYEFLRNTPELSFAAAQLLISRTCLVYFSFSILEREGSCKELAAYEARIKATVYWTMRSSICPITHAMSKTRSWTTSCC